MYSHFLGIVFFDIPGPFECNSRQCEYLLRPWKSQFTHVRLREKCYAQCESYLSQMRYRWYFQKGECKHTWNPRINEEQNESEKEKKLFIEGKMKLHSWMDTVIACSHAFHFTFYSKWNIQKKYSHGFTWVVFVSNKN